MYNQLVKHILLLGLLFFLPGFINAQQTNLNVITKTIEKKYDFSHKKSLVIKAEKGVINIQPSNTNELSIVLKLIAKHENKDIVSKELKYARYGINMTNKELTVSNYLLLPSKTAGQPMESTFRAEYFISVPNGINLFVSNIFGTLSIKGLKTNAKVDIEYCDLYCSNLSGELSVNSSVGGLKFTNIKSVVDINSRYSEISISNPLGPNRIKAEYGKIDVVFSKSFPKLEVKSDGAGVSLYNKSCLQGNFSLNAKNGILFINEDCYTKNKSNLTVNNSSSIYKADYIQDNSEPELIIETYLSDISLN